MIQASEFTQVHLDSAAESESFKLLIKGLTVVEWRLVDGIVRLSERDTRRRAPRLQLLPDDQGAAADVLIVDARDTTAMLWSRQQPWLNSKPVIWIDAASVGPGHTLVRRPVQWPILPVILSRAMAHGPHNEDTTASTLELPISSCPRIMLVDDSALARLQLRTELEQQGFEVEEAESVDGALPRLEGSRFDGVLMDVLMPGVDGYEGCRRIKARFRGGDGIPVVMLTSKSSPFDRIRGKMAGCDAYLTKPVNRVELNDVLARHVRQPRRFSGSAPVSTGANPVRTALAPSLH